MSTETTPTTTTVEQPKPGTEVSALVGDRVAQVKPEAQKPEPVAQEGAAKVTTPASPSPAAQAKTYDEAALNSAIDARIKTVKGGYEGTINKLKEDLKTARQESEKAMAEARQREDAAFLARVEQEGQDVDLAKQIVQLRNDALRRDAELRERQATLDARQADLDRAGKAKAAVDLAAQYNLGQEALAQLVEADDLVSMENKALKLHVEKVKQGAQKPDSVTSPAGSGTSGADLSGMTEYQKLGWATEQIFGKK